MFGTFVDLIETLKFSKSSDSIIATNSRRGGDQRLDRVRALELVQVLGQRARVDADPHRHVLSAFASSATSATFSRPPMLPGLRRMQWAPASIALSASVWLKWMSAITGIGESLTMVRSASTSLSRGTATRTRSAPASATLPICSMVASRFAVSVLVIVCTATGAPPPMGTPPTKIWRFEAI